MVPALEREAHSKGFGQKDCHLTRVIGSIEIVPKNLFTPIAPAHEMIDSALVLDSQLARHRQLFDPISNLCQ